MEDNQINQEETTQENIQNKNLTETNTISIKADEDTTNALKLKAKALLSIKTKRNENNIPEDEKDSKKRAVDDNNLKEIPIPEPTEIHSENKTTEDNNIKDQTINERTTEQITNAEEQPEVKEVKEVKEIKEVKEVKEDNEAKEVKEVKDTTGPTEKPKEETSAAQSKPIKKISITEAKREIDEFAHQIEKIELEIKNKYGIDTSEFYYEELIPEELKLKLVEDFFNSEEIIELSKKALN